MKREEAIKIIKSATVYTTEEMEALETLIPELRESKDERVRKAALEGIEFLERKLGWDAIGDTDILDVKEYLEKQKEQKPISSCDIVPYIDDKIAALQDMWREEKVAFDWDDMHEMIEDVARHFYQKEQTPAEKQDYSDLNDMEKAILRGFLAAGVENVPVTIIKETAQECLAQMKPAEWSEEDEIRLKEALEVLDESIKYLPMGYGFTKDVMYVKDWLKSIRPSWKPSEKELVALKCAGQILRDYGHGELAKMVFMIEGKLANLSVINESVWKPSEEQMNALLNAEGLVRANNYPENAKILAELYEQLKAL